jgi:hypothetical protein
VRDEAPYVRRDGIGLRLGALKPSAGVISSSASSDMAAPVANGGAGTFSRIADYPWTQRRRTAPSEPIVEVTVPYAIPNLADRVDEVRERARGPVR